MINKVLAAGISLAFMAVVQPDASASKLGMAFTTIMVYVAAEYCIGRIRREKHYTKVDRNKIDPKDIKRWADEVIGRPPYELYEYFDVNEKKTV